MTREELDLFLRALALDAKSARDAGSLAAELAAAGPAPTKSLASSQSRRRRTRVRVRPSERCDPLFVTPGLYSSPRSDGRARVAAR